MGKIDAITQMPEQCQFKAAQRGFWRTSDPCKRLNAVQVIEKKFREARKDMQEMFEAPVHLELWVKVKSGWADDERALRSLGYVDDL